MTWALQATQFQILIVLPWSHSVEGKTRTVMTRTEREEPPLPKRCITSAPTRRRAVIAQTKGFCAFFPKRNPKWFLTHTSVTSEALSSWFYDFSYKNISISIQSRKICMQIPSTIGLEISDLLTYFPSSRKVYAPTLKKLLPGEEKISLPPTSPNLL